MLSKVILIEATPRRAADGVGETVRLAGGGGQFPYYYAGQHYRAGVVQLPTIVTAITFEGGDFGDGGVPQAAELQWAPSRKADLAAIANYFWIDAPITVRIGDENAAGTLPAITISGKVLSATVDGGVVKLQLSDPAADLKKPLLTARFGGTGGVDGPAEWDGRIKGRVWGRVWNLEGDLIDRANNIYCWADPARPLQSFDALRDKGAPAAAINVLAWQGSVAATFAALQAAAAPQGSGVACPSIACVKWWTQPAGALTADLKGEIGAGYVETTAQIVQRIVQAGPNTPFAAGTIAAAQAARPAPVGWVANDDSTGVASMIEELLGNSSMLWLLNASGEIVLREWAWGASAASATSQSVKRTSVFAPVGTRKLGFKRNETQMARGDLAAIVLVEDVTYANGSPLGTVVAAISNTATDANNKADQALSEIAAIGDGTDGISAFLTNEAVQLFAYANGNVVSYSAATGSFRVFSGATDVSASFSLSTQSNPQTLTIGYSAQTFTVTAGFDAGEDTASVTIRATGSGTYAGVTLDKVFTLSKAKGGYEIVAALPSTSLFEGRMVFLTTDDKLYRYTGAAWTSAVPAADISGQIGDAQIAALASAKLTGQISGTQVSDGSISTPKLAAGSVVTEKLAAGSVVTSKLAVIPESIIPDPYFADEAFWTETLLDGGGWFFETDASANQVRSLGLPKGVSLAPQGAAARKHMWSRSMPFSGSGQVLRLRATGMNNSNDAFYVAVRFLNYANTGMGDLVLLFAANSGTATPSAQMVVPLATTKFQVIIYNQAAVPVNQYLTVGGIKLDVAASAELIVDGAISADKLSANSVIAGKIAADAVTTNNLQAGIVTAAKVAASNVITLSAQISDAIITSAKIGDAQITNAKIGNLQVDTIKIAGNAVTVPTSAYTEASLSASATVGDEVVLQSATMVTSGNPLYITFSCQFGLTQSAVPYVYIGQVIVYIDGSPVYTSAATPFPNGAAPQYCFALSATPASGTHTVSVRLKTTTINGGIGYATNRSLFTLETKR